MTPISGPKAPSPASATVFRLPGKRELRMSDYFRVFWSASATVSRLPGKHKLRMSDDFNYSVGICEGKKLQSDTTSLSF